MGRNWGTGARSRERQERERTFLARNSASWVQAVKRKKGRTKKRPLLNEKGGEACIS